MNKRKTFGFKPAAEFNNHQLSLCLNDIAKQRELLALVRIGLPAELSKHVLHCLVSGSVILLYSDSASWASQIRFLANNILEKLRDAGQTNVAKLQVRIMPVDVGVSGRGGKPKLPSAETIESLCRDREHTDNNDVLAVALMRLGNTLRRRARDD
ncbi:DciA family protein [Methylomonas koyamae]|uniref:DciA family protein n=1 Tax=Methylomonas koyamae TaxID=702114 RepID=UPI000BC35318|nr:DciA family protein [Methylomonas koyamae]ATG92212.1 hypothetical protein MKLM6_4037 [Methylomonas koyamae]